MSKYDSRCFINGELVEGSGPVFALNNPSTGEKICDIKSANAEDVEKAVAAAEAAQPAWEKTSSIEKAQKLSAFAALLADPTNGSELASLDALCMGRPISTNGDSAACAGLLNYYAGLAQNAHGHTSLSSPGFFNMTMRQPYGVTACIIPWNFPLILFIQKVGPAIAAGNTIIVKTSEKTPLSGILLAKLAAQAGFPAGVLQVLSGKGESGALLSEHMRIRKISFTGSTRTGKRIAQAAAGSNLKAVTLELGGKSPTLVFDDANLEEAVAMSAMSIGFNSGQICVASSRLYVQEGIYDAFSKKFVETFGQYKHGDPLDKETTMGPQADDLQRDAVQGYIDIGKKDGKVLLGGEQAKRSGHYFAPTVFTDVAEDSRINKEEVFGPVLVMHKFKEEADAIKRANDTEYGLYASVFTKDVHRAIRVAAALQSGSVGVNCTSPTMANDMQFGGYKSSGHGRENGPDALGAWLQVKSCFMKIDGLTTPIPL